MLTITVLGAELFDEKTNEFSSEELAVLNLEHTLVSLSKWESKFEKPFLTDQDKTAEEFLSYIQFMITSSNFTPEILQHLSQKNIEEINEYINAKMSATWFSSDPNVPKSREIVTSEVIYYWMTVFNIEWEAQYWHLNRLLTLIKVCNEKNAKPKKMSAAERNARNRELNARRKAELNTRG